MTQPVVLVIRNPDYENDIEVFGVEAKIIDVDLGRSFDGPKGFRALPKYEQAEWIDSMLLEVKDLSPNHPARERITQLINDMVGGDL